jgi:hypothetical protein
MTEIEDYEDCGNCGLATESSESGIVTFLNIKHKELGVYLKSNVTAGLIE